MRTDDIQSRVTGTCLRQECRVRGEGTETTRGKAKTSRPLLLSIRNTTQEIMKNMIMRTAKVQMIKKNKGNGNFDAKGKGDLVGGKEKRMRQIRYGA